MEKGTSVATKQRIIPKIIQFYIEMDACLEAHQCWTYQPANCMALKKKAGQGGEGDCVV